MSTIVQFYELSDKISKLQKTGHTILYVALIGQSSYIINYEVKGTRSHGKGKNCQCGRTN